MGRSVKPSASDSRRLFRVLEQKAYGYSTKEIVSRLGLPRNSVKQYSSELNARFHIMEMSHTEKYRFYIVGARPVVEHINNNPDLRKHIQENPDWNYQETTITVRHRNI